MANAQDATFVKELSSGNAAEITEGNLALKQSPEFAVKQFGLWMVTDHTFAGSFFANVAKLAGFSVSATPDPNHQAKIDQLSKLSGQAFDQAYGQEQVTDHQQTLALLQQEVSKGGDQGLVSFAKEMIPVIQAHLQGAQMLSSNLSQPTPPSTMAAMPQEASEGTMAMWQGHQGS